MCLCLCLCAVISFVRLCCILGLCVCVCMYVWACHQGRGGAMAHRSNDEEGQSAPHHRVRVPRDTVLERRGAADSVTRSRWRRGVCCVRSGRHGGSCSGSRSALPWAWPYYCHSGGGVGMRVLFDKAGKCRATGLASRVTVECGKMAILDSDLEWAKAQRRRTSVIPIRRSRMESAFMSVTCVCEPSDRSLHVHSTVSVIRFVTQGAI